MNPFHSAAAWLVGLLPANAPEWAVGASVMLGIYLVIIGMLAVAGIAAWIVERRVK